MYFYFQGDCRSYSYVCGISSKDEPDWESLIFLARLIPRMCHNINRYVLQGISCEVKRKDVFFKVFPLFRDQKTQSIDTGMHVGNS